MMNAIGAAVNAPQDRSSPVDLSPEIFEALGRQLRVAHRMLNVLVPQVSPEGSRIVAFFAWRLPRQRRSGTSSPASATLRV
jgi:hypothetical protein